MKDFVELNRKVITQENKTGGGQKIEKESTGSIFDG
jgi:hypothetical protein